MDKHDHHHGGGGFFNGFIIGAIIGAAVVFFLFTEKGKKVLKTITEEGIEGFSEIRDLVETEMNEDEEEEYGESEYEEHPLPHIVHHADHTHVEPIKGHESVRQAQDEESHYHDEQHQTSKVKRFFKRTKRN